VGSPEDRFQVFSEELLREAEAAAFLRVRPCTLRYWRKKRQSAGPVYAKVGARRVVYRLADLLAFVRRGVVHPRQKI
jgi:hypothetical protein